MFRCGRRLRFENIAIFKNFINNWAGGFSGPDLFILKVLSRVSGRIRADVAVFVHFGSRLRQFGQLVVSFVVPELQFVPGILRMNHIVFNFV